MKYYETDNLGAAVSLSDIHQVEYAALYEDVKERLQSDNFHVAH